MTYIFLGLFLMILAILWAVAQKLKDYDKWYRDYYDIK